MTASSPDLFFSDIELRTRMYTARSSVPDFEASVREYTDLSIVARDECAALLDLRYGMGAAERLDIFLPVASRRPAPVFIFLHGGYWRSQTKEDAPVMAPVFTRAGAAVVTVEYTLMPAATMPELIRDIRSAIAWVYHHAEQYGLDRDRIHVGGSSAGAHLAAMTVQADWQDSYRLPGDAVKGIVALSGLYDLRPFCDIDSNAWLRLQPQTAEDVSPCFHPPAAGMPIILSVGGLETDGFKNQTAAYQAVCEAAGAQVDHVAAAHANHFNLLCELAKADSPLTQATLRMMGLNRANG